MAEGFRERAERVNALLATAGARSCRDISARGCRRGGGLVPPSPLDAGLPFAGVVANRVHPPELGGNPAADLERLLGDDALARKVMRIFEEERRLDSPRTARTLR